MSNQDLEKLALYKLKMDYYKAKIDEQDQSGGYSGKKLFLYNSKDLDDAFLNNLMLKEVKTADIDSKLNKKAYVVGKGDKALSLVKTTGTVISDVASSAGKSISSSVSNADLNRCLNVIKEAVDEADRVNIEKQIRDSMTAKQNKLPVVAPESINLSTKFSFDNYVGSIGDLVRTLDTAMTTSRVTETNKILANRYLAIEFKTFGKNDIIGWGEINTGIATPKSVPVPPPKPTKSATAATSAPVTTSAPTKQTTSGTTTSVPATKTYDQYEVPMLHNFINY